jgi:hypothetical protein
MDEINDEAEKKELAKYPKMISMNEGRAQNREFLRQEWVPLENPEELLLKPEYYETKTKKKGKKKK